MRTRILKSHVVGSVVAVLLLGIPGWAQQTEYAENQRLNMESHVGNMTGHATVGAPIYKRFCIGCHGELGDGEGENAQWIDPKPRNFTIAIFRCRSTPTGTLPTDSDLYDTIGRGMLELQHAALAAAHQRRPRKPRRLREAFLAAMGEGEARHSHRHTAGAAGNRRENQGWPRTLPEAGVLEVSRCDGSRQWTFRRHLDRR